jgi:hypothetical protein
VPVRCSELERLPHAELAGPLAEGPAAAGAGPACGRDPARAARILDSRFAHFTHNHLYRPRRNCMEVATCTPPCARCRNHTHAFVQVAATMHRPTPTSGHHASDLTRNDLPASFGGGSGLEGGSGGAGHTGSAQRPHGRALRADWREPQPHPHLLAHVFQMTGFTGEYSGLVEPFVHPGAQKTPRSPNTPSIVHHRTLVPHGTQVPAPPESGLSGPP